MIKIDKHEVYSTDGKIVHRLGTESYFSRGTALPADTEANFEEVDEVPQHSTADYEAEVERRIRERYTVSQELAILRQRDTKPEEFAAYNAWAELCKTDARARMDGDSKHNGVSP